MTVGRARSTAWLGGALLLTALAGCKSEERIARTQILVSIDGDTAVRMQTERLRVELSSGPSDDALEALDPEVVDVDDEFVWPFTLALVPGSENKEVAFEVKVIAEAGGNPISQARARTAFLEGKTLLLEIRLRDECLGYFDCAEDETCVAENALPVCVGAYVDPADLPPFEVAEPDDGPGGGGDTDASADGAVGSSGDGGVDPGCVPTGDEQCFNAEDDDCDGKFDCADDDCDMRAVCVPHGETAGVLLATGNSCPQEFSGGEILLHQGLQAADCEGCVCEAEDPDCFAEVYFYDQFECSVDGDLNGGTLVGTASYACTMGPIGEDEGMYSPYGWRVGDIQSSGGRCMASGTATPGTPSWTTSMKLCLAGEIGRGCAADEACAPRAVAGTLCTDLGSNECPSWAMHSPDWYEDYSDTRECGNCSCAKSGSSCAGVQVELGSDWACGDFGTNLGAHSQDCTAMNYSPPARIVGASTPPTCDPSAPLNGELVAETHHDLCCLQ